VGVWFVVGVFFGLGFGLFVSSPSSPSDGRSVGPVGAGDVSPPPDEPEVEPELVELELDELETGVRCGACWLAL
jgi:hypothetical protein